MQSDRARKLVQAFGLKTLTRMPLDEKIAPFHIPEPPELRKE